MEWMLSNKITNYLVFEEKRKQKVKRKTFEARMVDENEQIGIQRYKKFMGQWHL